MTVTDMEAEAVPRFADRSGQERWLDGAAWRLSGATSRRVVVRDRNLIMHKLRHGANKPLAYLAEMFNIAESTVRFGLKAATRDLAAGRPAENDGDDECPSCDV